MSQQQNGEQKKPRQDITHENPPVDLIRDAIVNYPECVVTIKRQNDKGHWAGAASGIKVNTVDLADPYGWIGEMVGGGRFLIEAFSPHDKSKLVVPRFYVVVEGQPRAYMGPGSQHIPTPHAGMGNPVAPTVSHASPSASFPPFAAGMRGSFGDAFLQQVQSPQFQQFTQAGQAGVMSGPGGVPLFTEGRYTGAQGGVARYTPDEVLAKANTRLENELKEERRAREEDRRSFRAEIAQLTAKMDEDRRRQDEQRFQMQLQQMQTQIQTQHARPPLDIVGLVTAFAPIVTALMGTMGSRADKALEMQMQGLQTVIATAKEKPSNPISELLAQLAPLWPVIQPFVSDMMKARSPEGQAQLFETTMQSQLAVIEMLRGTLREQAESSGAGPNWVELLDKVIDGVSGGVSAFMEAKEQAALAAVPTPIKLQATRSVGAQPAGVPVTPTAQPQAAGQAPGQAASSLEQYAMQVVQAISGHPMVPNAFKNPPWLNLIGALHRPDQIDADTLALSIVEVVTAQLESEELPEVLESVLDDPRAALGRLLSFLPITRDLPQHAGAVLEAFVKALPLDELREQHGAEEGDEEGDEDGEDTAEPVTEVPEVAAKASPTIVAKRRKSQEVEAAE